MTFLPIVTRELRVTARRRRTYWTRFGVAAIALAFSGWSFLFYFSIGIGNLAGKMLFGTLAAIAWLYAVVGGIFKTADALSEEKREGTLGLLFLTDLKGYDVVLGKIIAASVNWFFGLLALFPILALSLLMGGVAPGEFWRKIGALANLLFYSLALGMFVSSFMRNERRAAGLTILLLLALLLGPLRISEWYRQRPASPTPPSWVVLLAPLTPFSQAEDGLYRRNPNVYWQSLAATHGTAWMFLLLASVIVPHTWQEHAGKISRLHEITEQFTFGKNPARRKRFRVRALNINPFYWVASRARGKWLGVMFTLGAVMGMYALNFWSRTATWDSHWDFLWPVLWLQAILKVWIAFEACRRFVDDRRSGALELILSTPLTPKEIIRGQWHALARQFGLGVGCVLCTDLLLAIAGCALNTRSRGVGMSGLSEQSLFLVMIAAAVLVFLADVIALVWLSMWRGMKARHSYTATLWTLAQILVGPWVLFYVGMTALIMLIFMPNIVKRGVPTTGKLWNDLMPFILTGLWFVLSMAVAILSAWWARRCLLREFRYQATASYQPPKLLFGRAKSGALPPRLA